MLGNHREGACENGMHARAVKEKEREEERNIMQLKSNGRVISSHVHAAPAGYPSRVSMQKSGR